MAFQEKTDSAKLCQLEHEMTKTNQQSIIVEEEEPLPISKITTKCNPGIILGPKAVRNEKVFGIIHELLARWKAFRYAVIEMKNIPRFAGLVAKLFRKTDLQHTYLIYLPPITKPITEYSTSICIFYQPRILSQKCNMKYTHRTMDVGAAAEAFQVIRNNPIIWSDILIHTGGFHFMLMFFSVIGSYLKGSGFEEVIFQAKLYASGCIKGIMNEKDHNRCWLIHEAFAQAVERLFAEEHSETLPPEKINVSICGISQCLNDKEIKEYISATQSSYEKFQLGKFGYTGQYWMAYVGLVDLFQKFHYAIACNDFDLRLAVWEELLPFCYHVHYACYGTYYLNHMKKLEEIHLGARKKIEEYGLSVCRNDFSIRQAANLAG